MFDYYAALADSAGAPVWRYEWPGVDPHRIAPELLAGLGRHGVVGIKDTTGTVSGITEKIVAAPSVCVYQACTPFLPEALEAGAGGIIAVTSTVFPDWVGRFWRSASRSLESAETRELHSRLVILDSFLRMGYPASAKWLLQQRGIEFGLRCRPPRPLPPDVEKALSVAFGGFAKL